MWGVWGEGRRKKSKTIYRTSQNIRIINVFLESLLSESLSGSHSPPHLHRVPCNTVLISGPAAGAAQILIWSYSCVFWPAMTTAIRISVFSFVSMPFYIIHRHRVCLVDHVVLICSLYSWWEGLGSSSLATLPLGFSCVFISTSPCGSSNGVCV